MDKRFILVFNYMEKFFGTKFSAEEANVEIIGVVLGRRAEEGLNRIRYATQFFDEFDVEKKRNLLEGIRVYDGGNFFITSYKKLEELVFKVKASLKKRKVLLMGGGHLLTYFSFKAFPKGTKLLVFDAHSDLLSKYIDEKIEDLDFMQTENVKEELNDATWLRKLTEEEKVEVMLIGIRSSDEEELEWMEKNGIKFFTSTQVKENLEDVKKEIKSFTKGSNVYFSLDIDVFDPSIAPAVHYPEPNGINVRDFLRLLESFDGKLVGGDIVCFNPLGDRTNQVTEFLIVKAMVEILGLMRKDL